MLTLRDAPAVYHPAITAAAATAAGLVLLGVLFTLAYLRAVRRERAREDA